MMGFTATIIICIFNLMFGELILRNSILTVLVLALEITIIVGLYWMEEKEI